MTPFFRSCFTNARFSRNLSVPPVPALLWSAALRRGWSGSKGSAPSEPGVGRLSRVLQELENPTVACASKTTRLRTIERCSLSQQKLSTNGKKRPLATGKIEQAESGQSTKTRRQFFVVDGTQRALAPRIRPTKGDGDGDCVLDRLLAEQDAEASQRSQAKSLK